MKQYNTPIEEIEAHDFIRYATASDDESEILSAKIQQLLTENVETLPFDFILHHLSRLGFAIAVINDDNGHWAVVADGYQSISDGDDPVDVDTHFWISARHWKSTLREALKFFLEDDDDEDSRPSDEEVDEAMEGFIENNVE